jgi:hypothetical protein
MMKIYAWEVWLACVVFDDGRNMKKRPIVILDEDSNYITAIELTSRPPKYADEFILSDWMRVGLKYQSTVKMNNIVRLPRQLLIHKIGDLGLTDIQEILSYTYKAEPQRMQPQRMQPQRIQTQRMQSRRIQPRRMQPRRTPEKYGCYIATSVYGSYNCPQVRLLRRYRDEKLTQTWLGRGFIRFYYTFSPTAVRWFGKKKWFNRFWRSILDKLICRLLIRDIVNTINKGDRNGKTL